jgi:multisubunit Na+/H+ antiporter MnhB subunit
MRKTAVRASYVCAAAALVLLALHFNAERLPAWTPRLAVTAGVIALAGALLAAVSLDRRGWTDLSHWPAQLAFAINTILALGFLAYPTSE